MTILKKGEELDNHVKKLCDEVNKMKTCSKGGLKREGASCSLNNNCIYPNCLELKIK